MVDKYLFVDTHFLVWAVQKKAMPTQQHMIKWSDFFFTTKHTEGFRFATAAICVSEFMRGVQEECARRTFYEDIERDFMIVSFDADAAAHASQLWHDKSQRHQNDYSGSEKRTSLPSDVYIAGTVLSFKPDCLVTNDTRLKKWVEATIKVTEIGEPPAKQDEMALPIASSCP